MINIYFYRMKSLKILKVIVLIFSLFWFIGAFISLIASYDRIGDIFPSNSSRFTEFFLSISFSIMPVTYMYSIDFWNNRYKQGIGWGILFLSLIMLFFLSNDTTEFLPIIMFLSISFPQILYVFLTKFWE